MRAFANHSPAATGPKAYSRWAKDGARSGVERAARQAAERRGRLAEVLGAALLMLKGYRILERRHRGPFGEIDLIAVRGKRLAFVEVKQRRSDAEARDAVDGRQAARMADAAERWLWRNRHFRAHRIGLDTVVLGAQCLPRHIPDALNRW
jgi:putative endonuclease